MKAVHYLSYAMALVFVAGETARRGIGYLSVNATTMFEDYFCAALLLAAALMWSKKEQGKARPWMVAAWAYATGGMFVPFFAHLEAWARGTTFRPDHPHADLQSVVLKGVIWAICLLCLVVAVRGAMSPRPPGLRRRPT